MSSKVARGCRPRLFSPRRAPPCTARRSRGTALYREAVTVTVTQHKMRGVARAPLRSALVALVFVTSVVSFPSSASAAASGEEESLHHGVRGDNTRGVHRRFLRQANAGVGNAAMVGTNPFVDDAAQLQQQQQQQEERTFSVQDQKDDEMITGVGAGPGDLGYDPMGIRSQVEKSSRALDIEDGTRRAIDDVRERAVAGEFGDGRALQKASKTLTPEEEALSLIHI